MTSPTSQTILSGQTQRMASVAPNVWVSRLAKLTAFATFILVIAGALVTGNKASLSDPTWPKFVGEWYPKYWIGGLKFEDSHRLIAGTVGMLMLALAVMLQLKDPRVKIRRLGWAAFGLVIAQAVFGGLVIHSIRTPWISMVHGSMAQAFFCCVLALAVFTSGRWMQESDIGVVRRPENASYRSLLRMVVFTTYLQVVVGTGVRHSETNFLPFILMHAGLAFVVIVMIGWLYMRTRDVYPDVRTFRRGALFCGLLVAMQVFLAVPAIYANRARPEPEIAEFHHVVVSTLHVVGGTLLLATLFVTMLWAYRLLARGNEAPQDINVRLANEVS